MLVQTNQLQGQKDVDLDGVNDLMEKYDTNEKKEQSNEDFIDLLKTDDKVLTFFIQNYAPGVDASDDDKFLAYEFSKYSEPGWTDDGKPTNRQVLSKKKAKRFAIDIVEKWNGIDMATEDQAKADKAAEAILMEDNKFEQAWRTYDQSQNQSGMLEVNDAQAFAR